MLIELLQNYGFSKNDAKVYLETLKFGEDTAGAIARRLGINRITVYSVLKSLAIRGISREIKKNGVCFFSVISPEKLVEIHEKKLLTLKKSLPNFLHAIYPQICKSNIHFYDGFAKVKEIFENVLNSNGEILHIASTNPINDELSTYLNGEYQEKRILLKKHTRLIYNKNFQPFFDSHKREILKKYRKILGIDFSVGKSMSSIILFDNNKIALIGSNGKNLSGFVLQNDDFFSILAGLFEMIWGAFHENIVIE